MTRLCLWTAGHEIQAYFNLESGPGLGRCIATPQQPQPQLDRLDTVTPLLHTQLGTPAAVISNDAPKKLQHYHFGYTPNGATKAMNILNARVEGVHNKNNDPDYTGAKGIIRQPLFRKAIRTQRCLILANGVIIGADQAQLETPYLMYQRNTKRPFAMAGIWDHWTDPLTGKITTGVAILTGPANKLLRKIGCQRAPIILSINNERRWLRNDLALRDITSLLRNFDAEDFNAYPITAKIRSTGVQKIALLRPIGPTVWESNSYVMQQKLVLQGMGNTASRQRREKERKKEENGAVRRTFGKIIKEKD